MTQLTYNFTTMQHWVMERSVLFAFADPRRGVGTRKAEPLLGPFVFNFMQFLFWKMAKNVVALLWGWRPLLGNYWFVVMHCFLSRSKYCPT